MRSPTSDSVNRGGHGDAEETTDKKLLLVVLVSVRPPRPPRLPVNSLPLGVHGLGRGFLHPLLLTLVHLLTREVFFVRGDRPRVPFGIDDAAAPISPELILHLPHGSVGDLGTG